MINVDKNSHRILTTLLYVVFATGYLVIILSNKGFPMLALCIYSLVFGLAIYSHIKFYRYDHVDPKAKIILIVNVILIFVFLFYDKSPFEHYFLLIIIGDCIFAFSRSFSIKYIIGIYMIFYPFTFFVDNYSNSGYTMLAFLEDAVISTFCIIILYMVKSQIDINVKYYDLLEESDEAYNQLKKYTNKIEELAVVEERNRIALILHNSIGHSLTSMMLSLQAEKMELVSQKKLDKDAFSTVEKLIQEAMSLLRKTIENADDFMIDIPFDELIDMFIREASNNTKVMINYRGDSTSYIKDSQKSVIFNIIIESITNAMKHSGCDQLDVSIIGSKENIVIEILDNGCGFEDITYGYGITKMIEQVKELFGVYKISSNKGCQIKVEIPNKEVTTNG